MQEIQLEAEPRKTVGTSASKLVRSNAKIPAVAYAKGMDPVAISVPEKPLASLYATGMLFNTRLSINLQGKEIRAVVRECALHPVKDSITHLDFQILGSEKCKVKIPVRFLGVDKCPGIKKGGFLNKVQRFIWVECLPTSIPQTLDFDISLLEIGKSVRSSSALGLPEGCSIIASKSDVVASILGKR